jgi:hypothetical protein
MPVIYDVANAFAIGEGLVGGLKSLWPRLGIVHLSDSPKGPVAARSDRLRRDRLAAIAALLKKRAYAGRIVLEILSDRPLDDLDAAIPSSSLILEIASRKVRQIRMGRCHRRSGTSCAQAATMAAYSDRGGLFEVDVPISANRSCRL